MRANKNKAVQANLREVKRIEKENKQILSTINNEQLQKKDLKELEKNLPSRFQEIKRPIRIKSRKKSKTFLKWMFSNNEK